MKKIGLVIKETSEAEIKSNLKDSGAVFVVKYSGLSSPDLTTLRQVLRDSNSNMLVVKNSVARRALKSAGLDGVIKSVDGPCGIVFSKSEAVDTSKALFNFAKDHEKLLLEGGSLEARILDKKDIEHLAKLPSKDVLRAQVLCAMKSPITGLVITLNQTLKQFVYCLDQVRQKKTV